MNDRVLQLNVVGVCQETVPEFLIIAHPGGKREFLSLREVATRVGGNPTYVDCKVDTARARAVAITNGTTDGEPPSSTFLW